MILLVCFGGFEIWISFSKYEGKKGIRNLKVWSKDGFSFFRVIFV